MQTGRVDRARREIWDLATSATHAEDYRQEVLRVLRGVVPWDGAVFVEFDPATLLITAGTMVELDRMRCAEAVEIELAGRDTDLYAELARNSAGVAVASRTHGGDLARSARHRELYRPHGLHDELRAVTRSAGACWGAMSLAREPGRDFSGDDAATVAALACVIAEGQRAMLLRAGATAIGDRRLSGPAVIVLDRAGAVESGTAEALELLSRLDEHDTDRPGLSLPMQGVVWRLRHSPGQVAQVRLRAADGGWLVLHAAPLRTPTGSEHTVVTIEPARPPQVVAMVAAAIGLSARETEILEQLLAGHSSVEIARRLVLSPHTVNDHIRHVFSKAGVHTHKG